MLEPGGAGDGADRLVEKARGAVVKEVELAIGVLPMEMPSKPHNSYYKIPRPRLKPRGAQTPTPGSDLQGPLPSSLCISKKRPQHIPMFFSARTRTITSCPSPGSWVHDCPNRPKSPHHQLLSSTLGSREWDNLVSSP